MEQESLVHGSFIYSNALYTSRKMFPISLLGEIKQTQYLLDSSSRDGLVSVSVHDLYECICALQIYVAVFEKLKEGMYVVWTDPKKNSPKMRPLQVFPGQISEVELDWLD
jgi:hypothetical protein